MNKWVVSAAAVGFVAMVEVSEAGLFSSIRDKISGEPVMQEAPADGQRPAPQQPNQGAPAGKAGAPAQPTPDPEKIKAGAKKLVKQLAWESIPGNLFQKYAGKWSGDLWVYTPSGSLEQHNTVQIECKAQGSAMTMETFYFDRISKLWTTAETATYTISDKDTIKVEIKRPNGKIARQTGHYNDNSLFLTADISDGVEHYRERIDGNRYLVDGFGVYGSMKTKDHHVFIARLQRQR